MGSNVVVQHHTGCSFTQCRGITSDAERTSIAIPFDGHSPLCQVRTRGGGVLMKRKLVKYIVTL